MTNSLQAVTVKIPLSDLRRIPEPNRSEFIRAAVSEKLTRQPVSGWKPKTATGRKLLALREKYLRAGGELLDSEGIAEELRQRRGGLA
jgi:Arc/MetJ-type ribon-helix-helix transcriptional regulator